MLLLLVVVRKSPAELTLILIDSVDNSLEFLKILNKFRDFSINNYFYEILDYLVLCVLTFDEPHVVNLVA
jgi:hypothetical protein